MRPLHGIDTEYLVCLRIVEVIADIFSTSAVRTMRPNMKPFPDEEPVEPRAAPPKRIRHPRIEVRIIGRRSIIGNYGRSFIAIIIAYRRRVGIIGGRRFIHTLP